LKIWLPKEEVKTGYETEWDMLQNIMHFKKLANETKSKISNESSKVEIVFLEMSKEV